MYVWRVLCWLVCVCGGGGVLCWCVCGGVLCLCVGGVVFVCVGGVWGRCCVGVCVWGSVPRFILKRGATAKMRTLNLKCRGG